MTIQKAIGVLTDMRSTCTGENGEALDTALDLMKRSIVRADIDSIISAVVRETGVNEEEMTAKGRQREFSEARAIVAWLAYHYTQMTLTSIGKRLGRDYSVIIYYNRMVTSWLDEPRLNLRGARITTKLINEIEDDNKTCD